VAEWHWEPVTDDLLDWLPPAALAAVRQVAKELTVRESMIFLDGREFTGEPPGLRTVQRGRDERITDLEACITQAIGQRADPGHRRILHGYAVWHHLRRLRGRPASRDQVKNVRDHVTAAAAFLDWLEERGLTLAACTQADLDQWLAGTSAILARSSNFVRSRSAAAMPPASRPRPRAGPARPGRSNRTAGGQTRAGSSTTTHARPPTASPGSSSCSTPRS
jgi:hypothetical protein